MSIYTDRLRAALTGAVDTGALASAWRALYPAALKSLGGDAAGDAAGIAKQGGPGGRDDPRVIAFLQDAWQAILAALRALVARLTAEGWVLGQQAAQATLAAASAATSAPPPRVDWRGWTPGDHDAAAAVAGAGLRYLLDQASIRIQSIADHRVEELADVLEQTLASDVTAITAEGPQPPVLSVGDLARQLRDVLDNPARAELVAWTEIARAQAEGARAVYAEAGWPEVDWITAHDARVCPACAAQEASNPHPLGQPPLVPMHPRCRCAEIPVLVPGGVA